NVGSHQKGFRVKIVKGVLTILLHGTPSFFTPQGLGSSSTRRNVLTDYTFLTGLFPACYHTLRLGAVAKW
ncbi:hypothetical protein CSW30_11560, partial [Thermus scotoductus]